MSEPNKAFTLQNGENIVKDYFSTVETRIYEDSLEVTQTEDLVQYILSMASFVGIAESCKDDLYEMLERRKIEGKIIVPKEYGMFICTL